MSRAIASNSSSSYINTFLNNRQRCKNVQRSHSTLNSSAKEKSVSTSNDESHCEKQPIVPTVSLFHGIDLSSRNLQAEFPTRESKGCAVAERERGANRPKPLACIPVTPHPVGTWVKPGINQVSLSLVYSQRTEITSPIGSDGKSYSDSAWPAAYQPDFIPRESHGDSGSGPEESLVRRSIYHDNKHRSQRCVQSNQLVNSLRSRGDAPRAILATIDPPRVVHCYRWI